MIQLLVATQNRGKVKEYRELLADLGAEISWLSLWDVGLGEMDVEETGATFEENARIKATAYREVSGLTTLADDSGLCVDIIDGEPGIYSARYGFPEVATDEGRYQMLLDKLKNVPHDRRTAHFECVVAIAAPGQEIQVAHGQIDGHIADVPHGDYGFGYDPVFELPNGRTMAELAPNEKHLISHRARALGAALPILKQLLSD
jgi:XTP/dITP diphosphohydrolase